MQQFKQGDAAPEGGREYRKKTVVRMWKQEEPFRCESREGIMDGQAGDFLAQDGHGGYYPISAQFHEKNYEPVDGDSYRAGTSSAAYSVTTGSVS